jgi:hypothetical protein
MKGIISGIIVVTMQGISSAAAGAAIVSIVIATTNKDILKALHYIFWQDLHRRRSN